MTLWFDSDEVEILWEASDEVATRWEGSDEVFDASAAPPGPAGTLVTLTVGRWPGTNIFGYHVNPPVFGSSDVTMLHGRTLGGFFWGVGISNLILRMYLVGATTLNDYPDNITIEDQNGVIRESTSRAFAGTDSCDYQFGLNVAAILGGVGDTQKIWA